MSRGEPQSEPHRLPVLRIKIYKKLIDSHIIIHHSQHSAYIKLFSSECKHFKPKETKFIDVGVSIKVPSPCIAELISPSNLPPFCKLRPVPDFDYNYLPDLSCTIEFKNHSKKYQAVIQSGDHVATVKVFYPITFQTIELVQDPSIHQPVHYKEKAEEDRLKGDYLSSVANNKIITKAPGDYWIAENPTE